MQKYFDHIAVAKLDTPIDQTDAKSPIRYVNRYEKTTLMFCMLENKFGRESLLKTLRALFQEFKGTRNATTSKFLNLIKQNLGDGAVTLVKEYLSTTWSSERLDKIKQDLVSKK